MAANGTKKKIARLPIKLKGFDQPDTTSQFEGFLDPGKYRVLEYKPNHPNSDTDYALVEAPHLGAGDTWICTRWREQQYAEITKQPAVTFVPRLFDTDPFAIAEEVLVELLAEFEDFSYGLDGARYPYNLSGVNLPQAPPKSNNCCTFVEALLVKAWENVPEFRWDAEKHRDMMIQSNDDLFSPVTAVVDSKMGIAVENPDTSPRPWTVIQGWRQQWRGGHTFLIVDHHAPTDRVLTLESNSAFKLNGVGFRAIGNAKAFGNRPPEAWWERQEAWTWERIQSTYRYRQQATLKVKDRKWSGLKNQEG